MAGKINFVHETLEAAKEACVAYNATLNGQHKRLVYRAVCGDQTIYVVAQNAGKARSYAADHFEIAVEPAEAAPRGIRKLTAESVKSMTAEELEQVRKLLASV